MTPASMTAASAVTDTQGKEGRGRWTLKISINMDISGTTHTTEVIILISESSELAEDNADEQVSDIRRIMRASESEK